MRLALSGPGNVGSGLTLMRLVRGAGPDVAQVVLRCRVSDERLPLVGGRRLPEGGDFRVEATPAGACRIAQDRRRTQFLGRERGTVLLEVCHLLLEIRGGQRIDLRLQAVQLDNVRPACREKLLGAGRVRRS